MAPPLTDSTGRAGPRIARWLAPLCWLLLAGVLVRLGSVAADQLRAPFDLVYESPNLASIEVIRGGSNPYSPRVYDDTPFVLTIYTPLYHYLVAALPAASDNPFFTGRLVALLCMLGSAALLFAAVPRGTKPRPDTSRVSTAGCAALAALAAAVFLAHWPVTSNAALLKNDPLALLCAGVAVVLVARGAARAARGSGATSILLSAVLPAVLCVLALAAKQSYVAAPVACALHLWLVDRRRARTFLAALVVSGGLFAALATVLWGEGFWFCTLTATRHPMSLDRALDIASQIFRQPLPGVLLALTLLTVTAALRGGALAVLRASPALPWAALSALVLALTMGKQGASTNYAFEFALAQSLWILTWLSDRATTTRPIAPALLVCGALLVTTGGDVLFAHRVDCSFVDGTLRAQRLALAADTRERVTRLAGPRARVLDLFSSLHTFSVQQQGFLNDPWLYSILWDEGTLSPAPLVTALRRGDADIVLLPASLDPSQPLAGPTGQVVAAVLQSYRLAETSARNAIYVRTGR